MILRCAGAGDAVLSVSEAAEEDQQQTSQGQPASQPSVAASPSPALVSGSSSSQPAQPSGSHGAGGGGDDDPQRPITLPTPSPALTSGNSQADNEEAMMQALGIAVTAEGREHAATIPQRTPDWHSLRALRLTGSELAAAVGESEHATPQQLVKRKLAALANLQAGCNASYGLFNAQQQRRLAHGMAAEPVAAMAYITRCPAGAAMSEIGFQIHPAHHWIGASPDRVVFVPGDGFGLLEIKCPAAQAVPVTLPRAAYLQALAQLACQPPNAEWKWVDIYYWTPREQRTWRVHWNSTTQHEWHQRVLPRAYHWFFTQFAPAALQQMGRYQQAVPTSPPPTTPSLQAQPPPTVASGEHNGWRTRAGHVLLYNTNIYTKAAALLCMQAPTHLLLILG